MRRILRIVFAVLIGLGLVEGGVLLWLGLSPPELLRVGTGYTAKMVCSNVFIAKRNSGDVLAFDVQAPGNPLLRLIGVDVDMRKESVTARMLGFIAPQTAVARRGLGCTLLPQGGAGAVAAVSLPEGDDVVTQDDDLPWPDGAAEDAPSPALTSVLDDATLLGPGMRAVVVVKDGRIVGESYGAGFDSSLPLIGWSMTKTVNAALIGTLIDKGLIDLDDTGLLPQWKGDPRAMISLASLMAMESGLAFDEGYATVSDATRMLFLQPDMAGFAASKPATEAAGKTFSYSSGTANILARIWMERLRQAGEDPLTYPEKALFGPLGMRSAVLETDAAGNFAASSYMYATARDWARFGLFLADDGVWDGVRLLPEGFVAHMGEATKASNGDYTYLQAWKRVADEGSKSAAGLPDDIFWLLGHDGQSMAVIRSEKLVVLRLGLTPSSLDYEPEPLVKAVIKALGQS